MPLGFNRPFLLMFYFPISHHVMFSGQFAFCLFIKYTYICSWMHEQRTTFERNCSLGYHQVVWNGKTIYTREKGLFSSTCLFSPFGSKEFCQDLNRSFDSKSAPFCLFFAFYSVTTWTGALERLLSNKIVFFFKQEILCYRGDLRGESVTIWKYR